MMRVPGRKDSGVIFTTVTELLPNGRLERIERDRPSGSGLERSREEPEGSESTRGVPTDGKRNKYNTESQKEGTGRPKNK